MLHIYIGLTRNLKHNMDEIVELAFCFNFWIYGGYVRDKIIPDEKPRDIDIGLSCSQEDQIENFVRVLSTRFKTAITFDSKYQKGPAAYGSFSKCLKRIVKINVDQIPIDLCVFTTFEAWQSEKSCDFTCNLFYQSRRVQLGMRYIPSDFDIFANPAEIIYNMTKDRKFTGIYKPIMGPGYSNDELHKISDLSSRALKMVQRGWHLCGNPVHSDSISFLKTEIDEDDQVRARFFSNWDAIDYIYEKRVKKVLHTMVPEEIAENIVEHLQPGPEDE